MLLPWRLKKIHLKILAFFIVIFWLFIILKYLRFTTELNPHKKEVIFDPKTDEKYERQLVEYESRIVLDLGKNGDPGILEGHDKIMGEKHFKKFALNTIVSNKMPLNRSLRDMRNAKCKNFNYSPKLNTSVIIIFYNELLSVILRTIWSVLLRTPEHLLKEIILVDDFSDQEPTKGLLDYYLKTRLNNPKIKLIRLPSRMGLIRARLQGARIAKGDVLIFLDSHCEAVVKWVEPLLSRIEEDKTAVLVPIIDVIDAETFEYSTNGRETYQVGGFTWSGHFTWIDIQNEEDMKKVTPVKSPTMAGGLFAIERNFFWDIGSYDEQMDGWGGENLEMSFRIWMCGGRLETVPCSRVGHVFRDFHPYSFPNDKDTHGINTARLAEVWMDDYKRLFFMHQPVYKNNPIIGDLTHRKQLRQKLRCKSFRWYLDNIYPELFIPDENVFAHGRVRNRENYCLDDLQLQEDKVGPLGLYPCHSFEAMSQYFSLTNKGELRKDDFCAENVNDKEVMLTKCHGHGRDQKWTYKDGYIFIHNLQKCISTNGVLTGKGVILEKCDLQSAYQKWEFRFINQTAVNTTL